MGAADTGRLIRKLCEGMSLDQYIQEFTQKGNKKKMSEFDFLALQRAAMEDGFTNPCLESVNDWEDLKFEWSVRNLFLVRGLDHVLNCETKDDAPTFMCMYPFTLNGVRINWIDCRNEYGTLQRAEQRLAALKK